MVSVAHDHVHEILHLRGFPRCVSKVIPSGDFLEYEQSDFITAVKKIGRLYVMRGPYGIAAQIVFKYVRVFSLESFRGGASEIRIGFMPVQPPKLQYLAVEVAFPVGFVDRERPYSHPRLEFIHVRRSILYLDVNGI